MQVIKAVFIIEGQQFVIASTRTRVGDQSHVRVVRVTYFPIGCLKSEMSTIGLEFSDYVWGQASFFYRSIHGQDGKHWEVDVIYQALMQFRD